jgi:hypothetical protein
MAVENAYALLTNIQGFDSFSLGPSSSPEEIARAFQTQVRAVAAWREDWSGQRMRAHLHI